MFSFLIKGLFRDKSRFLLPLLVVTIGSMITVAMNGYINGWISGMIDRSACMDTGHVKVMTQAYSEKRTQRPNDLAILDGDMLVGQLEKDFPEWVWKKRIFFGGIMDTSTDGSTSGKQGPISVMALDFNSLYCETSTLKLKEGIVEGSLPEEVNQVAIGVELSDKLDLGVNDEFLFLGSTMHGGLAFQVFQVSTVISFGVKDFDRATLMVDLKTAEQVLDMEDATGEIVGFRKSGYDRVEVEKTITEFNSGRDSEDRFAPVMVSLEDQNQMGELIRYYGSVTTMFILIFVVAMSLVMWNSGLISGIRRYQEFGIRLALGEPKFGLYRFLVLESFFVGCVGSTLGTLIGLGVTYYLKTAGLDFSSFLQDSPAFIPTVIRAEFSTSLFYIGFIPGLFSMVLGTMLSGIGIFRRQTALLMKELEA